MNWSHAVTAIIVLAVGIFIGTKYPSLLGKATGGIVSA